MKITKIKKIINKNFEFTEELLRKSNTKIHQLFIEQCRRRIIRDLELEFKKEKVIKELKTKK